MMEVMMKIVADKQMIAPDDNDRIISHHAVTRKKEQLHTPVLLIRF